MVNVVQKLYGVSSIAAGFLGMSLYLIRRSQVNFAYMSTDFPAWLLWGLYLLYGLFWLIESRRDVPGFLVFVLVILPLSCFFVREALFGLREFSLVVPLWLFGGLLIMQGVYWLFRQPGLSGRDLANYGILLIGLPAVLIVMS